MTSRMTITMRAVITTTIKSILWEGLSIWGSSTNEAPKINRFGQLAMKPCTNTSAGNHLA